MNLEVFLSVLFCSSAVNLNRTQEKNTDLVLEVRQDMSKYDQESAKKEFLQPWSGRRGIETIQINSRVALIKTSLDTLSNVLSKQALEVRYNVIDSEIELSGAFVFAFQLAGHDWSVLIFDEVQGRNPIVSPPPPSLIEVSKELGMPAIELFISDTSNTIGYRFFENGELVEYLDGEQAEVAAESNMYGVKTQRYVLYPYPNTREVKQTVEVWSRNRQITSQQIGNMWEFIERLLIEQDAFVPTSINSKYLLGSVYTPKSGAVYRVQNPGVSLILGDGSEVKSVPNLTRVDYFRFGNYVYPK
jgi:hypothetical protein